MDFHNPNGRQNRVNLSYSNQNIYDLFRFQETDNQDLQKWVAKFTSENEVKDKKKFLELKTLEKKKQKTKWIVKHTPNGFESEFNTRVRFVDSQRKKKSISTFRFD